MNTTNKTWVSYCAEELGLIKPILKRNGYTLDVEQPHLKGERYLMHAVTTTSGEKLILIGSNEDGHRVILKATRDTSGKNELERERECRRVLTDIDFAGEVFHTPEELAYLKEDGFVISIQKFIEQKCSFLERPIEEQFELALRAFKAQESAHATTYKHRKRINKTYSIRDASSYLERFDIFSEKIKSELPEKTDLIEILENAKTKLKESRETIEQYCGFLTHTDFVPHNIRIKDGTIYLLDHSSLTFGNKYEGWARFLNFMVLYNQPLERAFVEYVQNNRANEESESLKLMRIYRLGEIIFYYTNTLAKSSGNLLKLNTARIDFWKKVLAHVLSNEPTPESIIIDFQQVRDSLRSEDEKERQKGLH